MHNIEFDGQQEGEKILATIAPHALPVILQTILYIIMIIFFLIILFSIGKFMTFIGPVIYVLCVIVGIVGAIVIIWSNFAYLSGTKTYITDRRIIRFELLSPVYTAKRSLFWNEVLKAKGYSQSLFYRMFGIGTVQIETQAAESEAIRITHVGFYEDIANYIDKILYTFKNQPSEIQNFKPFVFASRGLRG